MKLNAEYLIPVFVYAVILFLCSFLTYFASINGDTNKNSMAGEYWAENTVQALDALLEERKQLVVIAELTNSFHCHVPEISGGCVICNSLDTWKDSDDK